MKNNILKTSDEFNAAYLNFKNSNLAEKLTERFRVKPFFEQYETLKNVVEKGTFFIHFFAVSTSFIGVFMFLINMVHNNIFAAVLSAVFLLLIETIKRLTIPTAIKQYLQFKKISVFLILASLALTTLSVALSFTGAHDTVVLLTPSATVTDIAPTKNEYKQRIKELEQQKRNVKKSMQWKGTLTPQGAKAYNQLTAQIGIIESDMIKNVNQLTDSNTAAVTSHTTNTATRSEYFAVFAVLFDLSLFFAFWFLEYYYFRSFAEFSDMNSTNGNQQNSSSYSSNVVATPVEPQPETVINSVATANNGFSLNANVLDLAIKKAKANIAAYNAKINKDEGSPESNAKGLNKWQQELSGLESMVG